MASITFQYRSTKKRQNLEARLNYLQSGKRRSQYTRIRFEVSKEFWEEYRSGVNFRDVFKANLKKDLEKHLDDYSKFIEDRFLPDENYPSGWLKRNTLEYYNPKPKEDAPPELLLDYFDYYFRIRESEITRNRRTFLKWKDIRNKVEKFEREFGQRFKAKDVNELFKKHFIEWCESYEFAPATIKKVFSHIKQVCKHARIKGVETSLELSSLNVNGKSKKEFPKIYLSFDELKRVAALENLPEHLDNARDWLLISCHTGQRISDFMRFDSKMIRKSKGITFLDVQQRKTGKNVTIPMIPDVIEILSKRDGEFPRRISEQKYNDYIKEVCRRADITQKIRGKKIQLIEINGRNRKRAVAGTYEKWELISSHAGRRSFATNYYGIMKTTYIKNITGHSTESMLLRYIGKTSSDTAYEAFEMMINADRK